MLTTRQVATRLGLKTVDAVTAWINQGHLPAVNVSAGTLRSNWRIAETDLQAFIESRRSKPPAQKVKRYKRQQMPGVIEFFK